MKKFADEGLLLKSFTQNIDGLELDTGLDPSLLVQAHGHMRSARCCDCRAPVDIALYNQHIAEKKVLRCRNSACNGLVKPDVVFFGESLPADFGQSFSTVIRP